MHNQLEESEDANRKVVPSPKREWSTVQPGLQAEVRPQDHEDGEIGVDMC